MRKTTKTAYRLIVLIALIPLTASSQASEPDGPRLLQQNRVIYSTYLGGSELDRTQAAALDSAGNLYVVGTTRSPEFPRLGAPSPAPVSQDAFVAKLDPAGSLVYSVVLGGVVDEVGTGIAVDAAGNAWVTGITSSFDFPRVNPLPSELQGTGFDAFVAKLGSDGRLLFSTRLGGSGWDRAWGIALDPAGSVYLVGQTQSIDFPAVNAVQPVYGGGIEDGFLVKLSPGGSAIAYSTYLGGSGLDHAWSVAVNAAGEAHVAGYTASADFPVFQAESGALRGVADGFVVKLRSAGSFVYSTYLGGSGEDGARAVALNAEGHALVTGGTLSLDFPAVRAFQPALHPGDRDGDAFLTALDSGGGIVFSTYLGGSGGDHGAAVAVDRAGNIHVTGVAQSTNFPLKDPVDAHCGPIQQPFTPERCFADAFVAAFSPDGSDLRYSTFLGGSHLEFGEGIVVSASGAVHVTGETASPDFPTVRAVQPALGGVNDAFVTKIAAPGAPPDCSGATASPSVLGPANGKMVLVSILGVTDPEGDRPALTLTSVFQDEGLTSPSTPDATGIGTSTALLRAARLSYGNGRVYHLRFTATDSQGQSCSGTVKVCVPVVQGGTCVDGGARVDSTRTY